jgi:hypothetical protein
MGIAVSGLGDESARSIGKAMWWQNLLRRENDADGAGGVLTDPKPGKIRYPKIEF